MQELIEADLPFERKEVPLQEAIEYFRLRGYEDKAQLFKYRRKNYLTLYQLGERMDYHHGYMVPSTGYLRVFDLALTDGGFTLMYPRRHQADELLPVPEYPKLLSAFRQYGSWLARLGIENVGSLNEAIESGRADEIVLVSEAFHELNLSYVARTVAEQLDKSHLILIAGPSSSGKTTFSRRLTVQLLALGISPFPLELDNYFLDRDKTPLGEDGKPDFEVDRRAGSAIACRSPAAPDSGRRSSIAALQLPDRDERAGENHPIKTGTADHPGGNPWHGPASHP